LVAKIGRQKKVDSGGANNQKITYHNDKRHNYFLSCFFIIKIGYLVHSGEQFVNSVFSVASITAFNNVSQLLVEATERAVQLEGPQELVDNLEFRTNSNELVDNILNAENAVFAQSLFNDAVVSDGQALAVNLGEATLVNQFADSLEVGSTISDVRLNELQHLESGAVQLNEHTVEDLTKTQQLQDLLDLRADLVDTRFENYY
jgi:hypothetical protein